MRAHELVKEFSTHDPGIGKSLEQRGYRYLGGGSDQEAYLEPGTGHVLKIFGTDCWNQISEDQQMFMDFADLCRKNANNPHLPRIYGVETFVWPTVQNGKKKKCIYLQIRMEALKPITARGDETNDYEVMADMIEEGYTLQDFLERYEYGPDKKLLKDPAFLKTTKGMWQTLTMLYRVGRKKGYGWDAAAENNILQRADGTPVVADPWNLGI